MPATFHPVFTRIVNKIHEAVKVLVKILDYDLGKQNKIDGNINIKIGISYEFIFRQN